MVSSTTSRRCDREILPHLDVVVNTISTYNQGSTAHSQLAKQVKPPTRQPSAPATRHYDGLSTNSSKFPVASPAVPTRGQGASRKYLAVVAGQQFQHAPWAIAIEL